jgi:hypothetical protein
VAPALFSFHPGLIFFWSVFMQQILTAQARAGMVLAKDVLTPEGRILCGKGTELSEALLERLARMEILHITVEGHPVQVEGEKPLPEQLREIDRRFQRVEKIAPLMYLKKRIKERLIASRS